MVDDRMKPRHRPDDVQTSSVGRLHLRISFYNKFTESEREGKTACITCNRYV